MFLQRQLLILLCLLMSSCMVGPNFHSPDPPTIQSYTKKKLAAKTVAVANHITAGNAQYFQVNGKIPTQWWRLFHSPEINNLVAMGLANSPNLKSAQAAMRQAQELLRAQIGNAFLPAVNGQGTYNRQSFSTASFGSPSPAQIYSLYYPLMNFTYMLDIFGGNRRQTEVMRSQVDYQQFQAEGTYVYLTSNIAATAILIASLKAQIKATHELLKAQSDLLAIVKKQYRMGGASGVDVLQQEGALANAELSLHPLLKSLALAKHSLAVLLGSTPSEVNIPELALDKLYLPKNLPVSLPADLVRQRPDIRAAEAQLHVASAQIGVATANMFPKIILSGNNGWVSTKFKSLFIPANHVWTFSSQLIQPLFNGGALFANRRAALAAYDQAKSQYQQVVLAAFQNVADQLLTIQIDAQALQTAVQFEHVTWQGVKLAKAEYRLGGVSYLELLKATQQYEKAKIDRIQAQAARFSDTVALLQALGGGWWNRDT